MSKLVSHLAVAAVATAGIAGLAVAGATAASANTSNTFGLAPGQTACVQQYAAYQVRVDGTATGGGAKFKVLQNGVVVANTPNRASSYALELRSAYGSFPGPGTYSLCATNTGTTNTIVTLRVRSDGEF
jgi:hypothetical protein